MSALLSLQAALGEFVGAAQGAAAALGASTKFAKLLLSVVKAYGVQLGEAKPQLAAVAQACKSFMAKSLLAAVAKL